jgi:hypothetical protein
MTMWGSWRSELWVFFDFLGRPSFVVCEDFSTFDSDIGVGFDFDVSGPIATGFSGFLLLANSSAEIASATFVRFAFLGSDPSGSATELLEISPFFDFLSWKSATSTASSLDRFLAPFAGITIEVSVFDGFIFFSFEFELCSFSPEIVVSFVLVLVVLASAVRAAAFAIALALAALDFWRLSLIASNLAFCVHR